MARQFGTQWCWLACGGAVLLGAAGAWWCLAGSGGASAAPRGEEEALKAPPRTPELLARGEKLFAANCAACHGAKGKADGEAAYLLVPKPRDLTRANFRLISTENQIVRVEDLYQTITRGMPGSAMPPWDRLKEEDRWALAHYTKSLGPKDEEPPKVIQAGPEPARDENGLARGREVFLLSCAACHGASGRGDGQQKQFDEFNFPTRPRDLTKGLFKGSAANYDLFCRIRAGMPGSPMPAVQEMAGEDIWHLVHYMQSLFGPGAESRNRATFKTLKARKAAALPEEPTDKAWQKLPFQYLPLIPLAWRDERTEGVQVRMAYDEKDLVVHLTWEDPTSDDQQLHIESFSDGVAVQLSPGLEPPFFAMGAKGAGDVKIWFWKASFEADKVGFQDVNKANPDMYVAHYPRMKDGPTTPKETRDAGLDEHNPTFLTGRGAGNAVSQPKPGGAESLTAHGFGTLGVRPNVDAGVRAAGAWQRGFYQALFRRPLKQEGAEALALEPGRTLSIGFAVWDGHAGDRNGQKSVTVWYALELEK